MLRYRFKLTFEKFNTIFKNNIKIMAMNLNKKIFPKIKQVQFTFIKKENLLIEKKMNRLLKMKLLQCYVFSMRIYGYEY